MVQPKVCWSLLSGGVTAVLTFERFSMRRSSRLMRGCRLASAQLSCMGRESGEGKGNDSQSSSLRK
jgi:hypothetical protein